MKKVVISFVAGLLAAAVAVPSNDLRLMFAIGTIATFAVGLILARAQRSSLIAAISVLPIALFYAMAILPGMRGTWPTLVIWIAASLTGIALARGRRRRIAGVIAAVVVMAVSVWYFTRGLPKAVSNALLTYVRAAAPDFTFESLDGRSITKASLAGNVVVLDFFGTWCAPCRAELPELARVRDELSNEKDVVFLVVANESGGDTPERVRAFATRYGHNLPFAMDHGGKSFRRFGLIGLPALAVLDSEGTVRLLMKGYNAAETQFATTLADDLRSMRRQRGRS